MPAEQETEERRGRPLPTILFRVGVGLAPLAALLLLFAQGNGALRIAAVLALLAVVLIGLSITLRGDVESVRLAMEESLVEEVEELRRDLRKDIETAARATHRAFGEKLQVLQNDLMAARAAPGDGSGGRPHLATGVVRQTGTVKVATRQAIVDPPPDDRRGNVYGGRAQYGGGGTQYGGGGVQYGGGSQQSGGPGGGRYGTEAAAHGRHRGGPADDRWAADQPLGGGAYGEAGDGDNSGDLGSDGAQWWSDVRTGDRWTPAHGDGRNHEVGAGGRHAREAGWHSSGSGGSGDNARGMAGDDGMAGGEWYGYPPAEDVPRAGGAPSTDLYGADARWR